MTLLTRPLRAVYDWFFTPKAVYGLALTRFLFGAIMLTCYLYYSSNMEWYYGSDGILRYMIDMKPPFTVTQRFLWPIYGAVIVSATCFCVGLFTRPAGICLALSHYLFIRFGVLHTWGWAETITPLIVYVSLSGAGGWASVDAWRAARRGRPLPSVVSGWALRLLQFHVSMIYVAAAWHRIDDAAWIRGEMVYEAMSNTWYTRLPYLDLQPWQPVLRLMTWATELAELAAPVALWIPRLRPWWVAALIALHTGLHFGASVGFWQPMMITGLLAFVDPERVKRVLSRGAAA